MKNPTHTLFHLLAAGMAATAVLGVSHAQTTSSAGDRRNGPAPIVRDTERDARARDRAADTPVVRRDVRTDAVIKRGDRSFIEKAARAGLEEVEVSRIAAERTSNPEVRRFAQMIIADHQDAHDELGQLATMKGVNLPAKEIADRWAKRNAKNFDRDYIDKMVSDHEDTVKLFERHAKDGEDVETVAFARKHLPKLQSHLQQAIDLKRVLKDK
jgi:putative membrane protein